MLRVVFMGTPDFAARSLEALYEKHEVLAVVTQPDKPKGRGKKMLPPPVKELALSHGTDVLQPKSAKDGVLLEHLKFYKPDVLVVVAYGKILPKDVLETAPYGAVNIHGSILPKLRGAAPVQRSIINGDKTCGITSMLMNEGMDTGDMLIKREVEIGENETFGELFERLSHIGAEVLLETLEGLEAGSLTPEKQDESQATYAPMIDKETERINWNDSAYNIINLARGLDPAPGAFSLWKGQNIKFFRLTKDDSQYVGAPGEVVHTDKRSFSIMTGEGAVKAGEVQLQGKKRMDAGSFMRGNKIEVGDVFE